MARPKKHTLSFEQLYNFDMIGICSHHSDYRLAWSLNNSLDLHLFKCDEEYMVTNKKGEIVSSHSMYECHDEEDRLDYFLIKNKAQGKFLIPEKPTIDYFLFLIDNVAVDVSQLLTQLKGINSVLGAFEFDPEEIGSAENLVFN